MDRLQDPGNIGTIIRTAEAAGYGGIVMMAGSGDVYASKVVRAAAGSLFRVPVIKAGKAGDVIRMVREMGGRRRAPKAGSTALKPISSLIRRWS